MTMEQSRFVVGNVIAVLIGLIATPTRSAMLLPGGTVSGSGVASGVVQPPVFVSPPGLQVITIAFSSAAPADVSLPLDMSLGAHRYSFIIAALNVGVESWEHVRFELGQELGQDFQPWGSGPSLARSETQPSEFVEAQNVDFSVFTLRDAAGTAFQLEGGEVLGGLGLSTTTTVDLDIRQGGVTRENFTLRVTPLVPEPTGVVPLAAFVACHRRGRR